MMLTRPRACSRAGAGIPSLTTRAAAGNSRKDADDGGMPPAFQVVLGPKALDY